MDGVNRHVANLRLCDEGRLNGENQNEPAEVEISLNQLWEENDDNDPDDDEDGSKGRTIIIVVKMMVTCM